MKKFTRLQQSVAERFGANHTETSDELAQAARDVDLRRGGLAKLQAATQVYARNMSKRKDADTAEGKLLPVDALGAVAIEHGDDFGHESAYGQALVAFGTAQRAMAKAQETYIERVNADFAESLDRTLAAISDYTTERKKLEGRRLTYDALTSKVQKSKTEKAGLEEELRAAKVKYEESASEVGRRAAAIQDGEMQQLKDLTAFVDAQMDFMTQCHDIISDLKADWPDQAAVRRVSPAKTKTSATRRALAPPATRSRNGSRSASPIGSDDEPAPPRSTALSRSQSTSSRSRAVPPPVPRSRNVSRPVTPMGSDDEDNTTPVSRSFSQKVGGAASTVANRARSGSGAVANRVGALRLPTRAATDSRTTYAALDDDDHQGEVPPSPPALRRSQTAPASPVPENVVEAKWAYDATADDELALSVGEQVSITRRINDEWAIGKSLRSKRSGMFPIAFTTPVQASTAKAPPPMPITRRPLTTTPARGNAAAPKAVSPFGDDGAAAEGTNDRDEAYGASVSELRKRLFAGQ